MRCWLLLGGLVHDEFGIELEQAYRIEQYQLRELCGFYITPFPIYYSVVTYFSVFVECQYIFEDKQRYMFYQSH